MKKFTYILLLFVIGVLSCDREFEIELSTPTIITSSVINIETTTAQSGGRIEKTGGADITAKGICWSTTSNPTIEDAKTENGTGDEEFTSVISGLLELTTYYVRSYATNDVGTTYGGEEVFTTSCQGITYDGDLTLATQGQINEFGEGCYDLITGNLVIAESDLGAIIDLKALQSITEVLGDVKIISNTTIHNLEGLHNIEAIGGSLQIYDNNLLENINDLSNIQSVGADIGIGFRSEDDVLLGNNALSSLNGLSGISSLNGSLSIISNPLLQNLEGLDNIETIGENLSIYGNDSLENLEGINNLQSVGNDLNIGTFVVDYIGNPELHNLAGLYNLESIGGDLKIRGNDTLENLDGIDNLIELNSLFITRNSLLANINGLSNLNYTTTSESVKNINISGTLIDNLNALSNLSLNKVGLYLYGNENLSSLDGLNSISSIHIAEIVGNSTLSNFCAISEAANEAILFIVAGNQYNPTQEEIADPETCSN